MKLLRAPKIIIIRESSIHVCSRFFYLKWWSSNPSEGYSNPTVRVFKSEMSRQQCYRNLSCYYKNLMKLLPRWNTDLGAAKHIFPDHSHFHLTPEQTLRCFSVEPWYALSCHDLQYSWMTDPPYSHAFFSWRSHLGGKLVLNYLGIEIRVPCAAGWEFPWFHCHPMNWKANSKSTQTLDPHMWQPWSNSFTWLVFIFA